MLIWIFVGEIHEGVWSIFREPSMITLTGNTALHIYAQSGIGEEVSGSPSCSGLDWGHGRAKDL